VANAVERGDPSPGARLMPAIAVIRPAKKRDLLGWILLALPTAYFLSVFAWPFAILVRMAFSRPIPHHIVGEGISVANFTEIFTNPLFLQTLWVTLRIGFFCTLFALLLGYPLAFFLARTRSRWRGPLLFLTLAPILISVVVRAYGWIVILSNRGLLNSALMQLGLVTRPVRMIFNETGIIIGTTHVLLPFMVLSILSSLQTLDNTLEDAAASMGARPWRVFVDVILPLSLPGVAAGVLLVFVLSVSAFVTPVLLGGQLVLTIPILALQQFSSAFNWPFGSALVVLLLVTVLTITAVYDRVVQRRLNWVAS
jgi:putative spermidine/putrescine transport system permease protein